VHAKLLFLVIREHDYIIGNTYFLTEDHTEFQWIHRVSKCHPAFIVDLVEMSWENSIVSCAVVLQYERFFISCFFTCLVTRAVHLEVTFSLSTDSFIMWLRWSNARRGKPTAINSDNGANFELHVSEYMDVWNQDKIGRVLSKEEIQWVFNPPAAPQMGGVWEHLVRSSKKKC